MQAALWSLKIGQKLDHSGKKYLALLHIRHKHFSYFMATVNIIDGAEGQPPPVQLSPLWVATGSPCHQIAVEGKGLAWSAEMRHCGVFGALGPNPFLRSTAFCDVDSLASC